MARAGRRDRLQGRTGSHDAWLDIAVTQSGSGELSDEAVPIPPEPAFISELRDSERGTLYVMPDSAEPVPPEILAGLDGAKVTREARDNPARIRVSKEGGRVILAKAERDHLKSGGDDARLLLETLERGLDATTTKLETAADDRLRQDGLL
jgi:hypothetical protein